MVFVEWLLWWEFWNDSMDSRVGKQFWCLLLLSNRNLLNGLVKTDHLYNLRSYQEYHNRDFMEDYFCLPKRTQSTSFSITQRNYLEDLGQHDRKHPQPALGYPPASPLFLISPECCWKDTGFSSHVRLSMATVQMPRKQAQLSKNDILKGKTTM